MKELLASSPRSYPPSLKTHLSSFLCHTPFFCILRSPSRSGNRDSSLLTASNVSSQIDQKVHFFGALLVTFCASCNILSNFLGIELFGCQVVLFLANVLWPSDALLLTVTPSGPSYMQICVGATAITILVRGRAISWLHALKQLYFAPPPPQQSFADVLGEIQQEIIIF